MEVVGGGPPAGRSSYDQARRRRRRIPQHWRPDPLHCLLSQAQGCTDLVENFLELPHRGELHQTAGGGRFGARLRWRAPAAPAAAGGGCASRKRPAAGPGACGGLISPATAGFVVAGRLGGKRLWRRAPAPCCGSVGRVGLREESVLERFERVRWAGAALSASNRDRRRSCMRHSGTASLKWCITR